MKTRIIYLTTLVLLGFGTLAISGSLATLDRPAAGDTLSIAWIGTVFTAIEEAVNSKQDILTTGSVTGDHIADGDITAADLAADSVTALKIVAGAVGASEIATGAVVGGTGGDILDGTITAADLGVNSVGPSEIAVGAVVGGTGGDIADGTITAADLAANSVAASEIAASAVGASEIAANAVGASEIATGAVVGGTGGDIADNTITAKDLALDSVGPDEIAANAVGASEIAASAVGASEIATGAVRSAEVLDNSITNLDTFNEAGADGFDFDVNYYVDLLAGDSAYPASRRISSTTIVVPSAGVVVLTCGGSARLEHYVGKATDFRYSIDTTSTVDVESTDITYNIAYIPEDAATGLRHFPVNCLSTYAVTAGSYTFYFEIELLVGKTFFISGGSNGQAAVVAPRLVAMFFPTRY